LHRNNDLNREGENPIEGRDLSPAVKNAFRATSVCAAFSRKPLRPPPTIQHSLSFAYPLHKITGKTGYFRNAGSTAASPHK
jgi:hypothetical protein